MTINLNGNLKAAIIEPVGGHGGMNYYDFGLIDGLIKNGVNSFLYTCDSTTPPYDKKNRTFCFFRGIYGSAPKTIRFFRFFRGLICSLRHAKLMGASLVHYHFFHYSISEIISIICARVFGIRVVITAHDVESFISGSSEAIARFIFKNVDGIIVHNKISEEVLRKIVGYDCSNIAVIPHGNYLDFLANAPSREEARNVLSIPTDCFMALFFGQIKKVKGLDLLLEAWKKVDHQKKNSLLVLAGKIWKDDAVKYQEIVEKGDIRSSVRFDIRYVPDREALSYYAAADLIVLPYRKIYQSGVLLMAMSHARAVLVSDIPGMTEIIEDGVNGFVFHSEDIQELSKSLIGAMQDTNLRESVAQRGLQTVLTAHSWHKIGAATKVFYERICTGVK